MKRKLFLFSSALLFAKILFAQTSADTISPLKADSLKQNSRISGDSLRYPRKADSNFQKTSRDSVSGLINDSGIIQMENKHEISGSQSVKSVEKNSGSPKRMNPGKELFFYVLIVLLLLLAFLKNIFPKYFGDLFRLFFRTTLKQRQIREQLMQTTLPSIIFNAFFIISAALYIDLLLHHFNILPSENFWLLFLYCIIGLSIVYLLKYLGLKLSGWLFNMKDSAESYIFIVFIVNKMIGIYLLPFLILLSFTEGNLYKLSFILSLIGVLLLFIYRFILTFSAVHNQIKVNLFHFFLYLCAFEIAPLILIYKLLLFFFE